MITKTTNTETVSYRYTTKHFRSFEYFINSKKLHIADFKNEIKIPLDDDIIFGLEELLRYIKTHKE